MKSFEPKRGAIIIGAGPAGLTAGAELAKNNNFQVIVLEKFSCVGGISRTTEFKGCKFDIGPHHFITHDKNVENYWLDLMKDELGGPNDFKRLTRFTRIFYKKKFFNYPLQAYNVITNLNFFECLASILSYIKISLFPIKNVKSFQDWVTNKFGYRLFSIFFKTYTEKVWGISCEKISADWASQRIKNFSLSKAIFYAFFGKIFKKNVPRTLADQFYYPQLGAGTLWEKLAKNILKSNNSSIQLNQDIIKIEHENYKIKKVCSQDLNCYSGDYFFSSMPLKDLIVALSPTAPENVIYSAKKLNYRALITINFIVNKAGICPDHWLYIHEKEVVMGRVGNMNNFSLKMVNNPDYTALSLEYFTFTQENFWFKQDGELLELGKKELEYIGLVKTEDILDGFILREEKAYPVYDENYKEYLNIVLAYLAKFENLELMGRNGLHQYNNMDIAMLSAFTAVNKVLEKEKILNFIKSNNSDKNLELKI